jgi:alpha-galactosidase
MQHAMRDALAATGTDIFYSIHSPWTHHPTDGSKYGPDPADSVSIANCWRTTNDIKDNFTEVLNRAHVNDQFAHLAGPGHWNDPDMLEVTARTPRHATPRTTQHPRGHPYNTHPPTHTHA